MSTNMYLFFLQGYVKIKLMMLFSISIYRRTLSQVETIQNSNCTIFEMAL